MGILSPTAATYRRFAQLKGQKSRSRGHSTSLLCGTLYKSGGQLSTKNSVEGAIKQWSVFCPSCTCWSSFKMPLKGYRPRQLYYSCTIILLCWTWVRHLQKLLNDKLAGWDSERWPLCPQPDVMYVCHASYTVVCAVQLYWPRCSPTRALIDRCISL